MAKITDYAEVDETKYEYSDAEYLALSDAVGIPLVLLQRRLYENEKGEGVVIVCKDCEGHIYKIFTHSVPICNLLRNPSFDDIDALPDEVEFTVKKGRSKKSKMDYFYLA